MSSSQTMRLPVLLSISLITQKEKRMEEWKQEEFNFNEWQEDDKEIVEDLSDIIVNGRINIANDWLEFKD